MSVVGCLLTEQPSKRRTLTPTYVVQTYEANPAKKKKRNIAENTSIDVEKKVFGITDLLALKPTIAVLEPTGVNYSKFWIHHLKQAGVEVLLVGHDKLRRYRNTEDKDDAGDAYALASYYFENYHDPSAWLRKRHSLALELRDIALRLNHVNRLQNPAINRLRQDLAWQFPLIISQIDGSKPVLGMACGVARNP
jgi:transposase